MKGASIIAVLMLSVLLSYAVGAGATTAEGGKGRAPVGPPAELWLRGTNSSHTVNVFWPANAAECSPHWYTEPFAPVEDLFAGAKSGPWHIDVRWTVDEAAPTITCYRE